MSDGSSGRLTTHVLDTSAGVPAEGLAIELYRLDAKGRERVISVQTNNDGRCDAPLLEGAALHSGEYELVFDLESYFGTDKSFYKTVPVRFVISKTDQHYHVPLLVSPFGYSTYRGS